MSTAKTTNATAPVDLATMRETVDRLMLPGVQSLDLAELDTVTALLRGHIGLMIPEVRAAALTRPKDDTHRYVALACATEASGRLERLAAGPDRHDVLMHARRLARSLAGLCDYYEALTDLPRRHPEEGTR